MDGNGVRDQVFVTIVSERMLQRLSLATLLRSLSVEVELVAGKIEDLRGLFGDGKSRTRTNVLLLDIDSAAAAVDRAEWTAPLHNLTHRHPKLRVVMLSDSISIDDLAWGLSVGISGFLNKSVSPDRLLKSLDLVMAGEAVLPMDLTKSLMVEGGVQPRHRTYGNPALLRSLSERQTGQGDLQTAVRVMKADASDFIGNPVDTGEILASIDRALERLRDAARHTASRKRLRDADTHSAWRDEAVTRLARLTRRQREIMDMILAGHPNKNIAMDLGISQRTVEKHRGEIMKRTGTKSLPALARLAFAAAEPEEGCSISTSSEKSQVIEVCSPVNRQRRSRGSPLSGMR